MWILKKFFCVLNMSLGIFSDLECPIHFSLEKMSRHLMCITSDENWLIASDKDGSIRAWSTFDGSFVTSMRVQKADSDVSSWSSSDTAIHAVHLAAKGRFIVGHINRGALVWELSSGLQVASLRGRMMNVFPIWQWTNQDLSL